MAYVTIPKDLTKVKSKVLFGLTKRQLICFGAAALIGVPLFFLLRRTASNSAAAFCMIIVMLPFFLLAMYERHGQPLEVVAGQVIRCMFLRTKERPYQTNNNIHNREIPFFLFFISCGAYFSIFKKLDGIIFVHEPQPP